MILITSDIHLTSNPDHEYRWEIFDVLYRHCVNFADSCVIFAGDLTEKKNGHSAELVNRMANAMCDLADVANVYILPGNHDSTPGGEMFFGFLKLIGRTDSAGDIRVFNRLRMEEICGRKVLFVPFDVTIEDALDFRAGRTKSDIAILHHSFKGVRTSSGYKLDHGHDLKGVGDLATIVVSGDIHERQKFGPVNYIGTPYPIDFDEQHECRIIQIPDGRIPKIKSIPVNIVKKHTLSVHTLKELGQALSPMVGENQVKVRWHLSTADLSKSSELYSAIVALCVKKIVKLTGGVEFLISDQPAGGIESVTIKDPTEMTSVRLVLDQYIKMKKLKGSLVKTGKRIARK